MLTHQDQNNALLIACENGHLSTVNLLLQRGSVVDHQNQVTYGHNVKILIQKSKNMSKNIFSKNVEGCRGGSARN